MKYAYLAILAILFSACSRDGSPFDGDAERVGEETVTSVSVQTQGFKGAAARTDDGSYDWQQDPKYNTPDDLFPKQFVQDESLLFIAQKTPQISPVFPTDWTDKEKYRNLYVYKYQENSDANWDEEYNFVTDSRSRPIDWSTIRSNGSDGNAFKFFAMYFPGGTPQPSVSQWQSNASMTALSACDVLGAYHATPSLYSRMRFKLYHLMCYVRVTLYVPVVEPVYGDDGLPVGYSGFDTNAFEDNNSSFGGTRGQPGCYIGSGGTKVIAIRYKVDYTANRSSDNEAPLIVPDYTTDSSNPAGVSMYLHREFGVDNENGASEILEIDKSLFMNDVPEKERFEKVRRYEFSAYIPTQDESWLYNKSYNPDKNLFYMTLKTPGSPPLTGGSDTQPSDGTYKHFYFTANYLKLQDHSVVFTQGTLQHFYLYVPRSGNNTITIRANVVPWTEVSTDMTVTEQ